MKQWIAFLMCVMMFAGCGSEDSEVHRAMQLRQKLTGAQSCEFDCAIIADYGDVRYTFGMHCMFDESGNLTFRVTEPESIRDITGKIDNTGGKLTFDDSALMFQLMADGYLSPVSAPWIFMKTLRGGYIQACGKDGEGMRMILNDSYEEDPLQVEIWTDEKDTPVYSEILWQGRKILSLSVSNFTCL